MLQMLKSVLKNPFENRIIVELFRTQPDYQGKPETVYYMIDRSNGDNVLYPGIFVSCSDGTGLMCRSAFNVLVFLNDLESSGKVKRAYVEGF